MTPAACYPSCRSEVRQPWGKSAAVPLMRLAQYVCLLRGRRRIRRPPPFEQLHCQPLYPDHVQLLYLCGHPCIR